MPDSTTAPHDLTLPEALAALPVLVTTPIGALLLTADGEIQELSQTDGRTILRRETVLVCHAESLEQKLKSDAGQHVHDILDLFAFIRPAQFCVPTPRGVLQAMGLPTTDDVADQALGLKQALALLWRELATLSDRDRVTMSRLAQNMAKAGWVWGVPLLSALGMAEGAKSIHSGLEVWQTLTEWQEQAPPPPPGDAPVNDADAQARLLQLTGEDAEDRASQRAFTATLTEAFQPRETPGMPRAVLAEAGTGTGKTLGYVAPASLWAEANDGPVWLATYTKNLQRQLLQELDKLYPDPRVKAARAVVRKGRENYLCMLNYAEMAASAAAAPARLIHLGLIARWIMATQDGDMIGGDLPAWLLAKLKGAGRELSDRRGECVYASCDHWKKCFIEKSKRRAQGAHLVIANHALVLVNAALHEDDTLPTRYVFDEAHHLFDAADNIFASHLTGAEAADLRRWIRGAETGGRSRARGLERRVGDLLAGDDVAQTALQEATRAAAHLPAPDWLQRLRDGLPQGPGERFFAALRQHVQARAAKAQDDYTLEAPVNDPGTGLVQAARDFASILQDVQRPLTLLARQLGKSLAEDAETLDSASRSRLEAARRGLTRRCDTILAPWRTMLDQLGQPQNVAADTEDNFVDWSELVRAFGRDVDVGLLRHWVDPTRPLAQTVFQRAHGVAVTSATLRDDITESGGDTWQENTWQSADMRTGFSHLPLPAERAFFPSPFDYVAQTKIFIVRDVNRMDAEQVAGAFLALFTAAGGGALGLFTAIRRLRTVYGKIAAPLAERALTLYAQHVDALDAGTLVDIFRAEPDSCLLGTDAVRDGVDVPGDALRLIVFDRVPWPRPTLLHKARKAAFGGSAYDDMITRLRLKQAYGRLIRRQDDRGVFVMLDGALPSRLLTAFPEGVEITRGGLAEAVAATKDFLGDT